MNDSWVLQNFGGDEFGGLNLDFCISLNMLLIFVNTRFYIFFFISFFV